MDAIVGQAIATPPSTSRDHEDRMTITNVRADHYSIPLPVVLSDAMHGDMPSFELMTARVTDADGNEVGVSNFDDVFFCRRINVRRNVRRIVAGVAAIGGWCEPGDVDEIRVGSVSGVWLRPAASVVSTHHIAPRRRKQRYGPQLRIVVDPFPQRVFGPSGGADASQTEVNGPSSGSAACSLSSNGASPAWNSASPASMASSRWIEISATLTSSSSLPAAFTPSSSMM